MSWEEEYPEESDGCVSMLGYGIDPYGVSPYGSPAGFQWCTNNWIEEEPEE